jgi:type IV pilus assembly protein PilP
VILPLALAAPAGATSGRQPPPVEAVVRPPATSPPPQPPPPDAYVYNPAGRRDPFVSLLGGTDVRPAGRRPEGLAGLLIGEAVLKGIVRTQGQYLALLQAPDNRSYVIRPGSRLFDGTVKSITAREVVFVQEVNDPLSLIKQREVRRVLRAPEEAK